MRKRGFAAPARHTLIGLALISSWATSAFGGWPELPTSGSVATFARGVDSVVVWSVGLPDSAQAAHRHGVEIFDAAHPRQRTVMPRQWGRRFVQTLLTQRQLDGYCTCGFVKERSDSAEVVVPFAELHVAHEVMWVAIAFRDSCAAIYLLQGPWGTARLDESRPVVLAMLREALPSESAFARDSFPPMARESTAVIDFKGPGVELPEAIDKAPPPYPTEAREDGISGTVEVEALVDTDGTVADAFIAWSVPPLDAPAIGAVRLWRFRPARLQGRPIKVWVTVPVKFTLH